jgi:hypothetical protein
MSFFSAQAWRQSSPGFNRRTSAIPSPHLPGDRRFRLLPLTAFMKMPVSNQIEIPAEFGRGCFTVTGEFSVLWQHAFLEQRCQPAPAANVVCLFRQGAILSEINSGMLVSGLAARV